MHIGFAFKYFYNQIYNVYGEGFNIDAGLLRVYDNLGQEVATLVNKQQKPGTYKVEWNAVAMPSGVYFYKLKAGKYSKTRKMILMK